MRFHMIWASLQNGLQLGNCLRLSIPPRQQDGDPEMRVRILGINLQGAAPTLDFCVLPRVVKRLEHRRPRSKAERRDHFENVITLRFDPPNSEWQRAPEICVKTRANKSLERGQPRIGLKLQDLDQPGAFN